MKEKLMELIIGNSSSGDNNYPIELYKKDLELSVDEILIYFSEVTSFDLGELLNKDKPEGIE